MLGQPAAHCLNAGESESVSPALAAVPIFRGSCPRAAAAKAKEIVASVERTIPPCIALLAAKRPRQTPPFAPADCSRREYPFGSKFRSGSMTPPPHSSPAPAAPPAGGHGFGTAPVFLASISTILGAILFLRFGYAVGNLRLLGSLELILLGHLVTIPTAMAIAEIATHRRVAGGGEYSIISRSFGAAIGGAIGISLYLSQAVSAAFYMIAFAEAFQPLFERLEQSDARALGGAAPELHELLFVSANEQISIS